VDSGPAFLPAVWGVAYYGKSAIFVSGTGGYRELVWIGSAKADLQKLPESVQDDVGYSLGLVQIGEIPKNASRMRGNLRDVLAIKVDDEDGATYRTTCVASLGPAIYVLDIFKKKSTNGTGTSQRDLDRIANRLRQARENYAGRQRGD